MVELVELVCSAGAAEVAGFLGISRFGVVEKLPVEDCVVAFLELVLAVTGLTSPTGVAGLGSSDFPGPSSFLGLVYETFRIFTETDLFITGNELSFFAEDFTSVLVFFSASSSEDEPKYMICLRFLLPLVDDFFSRFSFDKEGFFSAPPLLRMGFPLGFLGDFLVDVLLGITIESVKSSPLSLLVSKGCGFEGDFPIGTFSIISLSFFVGGVEAESKGCACVCVCVCVCVWM